MLRDNSELYIFNQEHFKNYTKPQGLSKAVIWTENMVFLYSHIQGSTNFWRLTAWAKYLLTVVPDSYCRFFPYV
jgi:hypothetical protein